MEKNVRFCESIKIISYEDHCDHRCDQSVSGDLIAKQRFEDYLYNLENRLTLFVDETFYPIKSFFNNQKKKQYCGIYREV